MIADSFLKFDPASLGPDFVEAFRVLKSLSPETPAGRISVSDRVYINVMEYDADAEWNPDRLEAHREYADVQVVLSGREAVAWADNEELPVADAYNPDSDVLFHKVSAQDASRIELKPGLFAVFFPQDGHYGKFAPASGPVSAILKAVAKVKLN